MSTAVQATPPDARLALAHTFLMVPGDRPAQFAQACASGADAVVIDLEDAVAPAAKGAARDALANWLDSPEGRAPHVPVLVRVNCVNSGCFGDDLVLCHRPGIAGIVLPKTERVNDVASASSTAPLFPMIETALGFSRLAEIAAAPRVQRLMFGAADFCVDLRIMGDGDALLYFRSQIVLASRLAGLHRPVDGGTLETGGGGTAAEAARHAYRLGFGGKLCLHAEQVDPVARAFAPSAEETAWARRVLAAAADTHAPMLDGQVLDKAMILLARQISSDARRYQ
ncbi:CoA ester lyase [Duganella sp. FT92W]|uniref:CoA ester lyase n=1 Tax=Pseudoduganella rivuli TaxID=2666085 RepID=A0A7X2LVK4_9BURK|nr:CoA ester lyase [Pseudoduganella rivuli]MRV74009.1 CoA ester lyase [Pseudoduganella rivuli]